MRRVLVTGGTGFIGGWTVAALIARGWQVRIYDGAPRREILDFVDPSLASQVEIVTGDINDEAALASAAIGCEAAVHLVGIMTVASAADPVRGATINLMGSLRLFAAAKAAGMRHVAYVSSAAVYGPDSSTVPHPMSLYGTYKLAVEGVARCWWLDQGLSSTGFRPFIVYGPGESSGIAAGPSIACREVLAGRPSVIGFSGTVGFVHVRDVASALVSCLDEAGEGAHVHDLNGITAPVEDFVDALRQRLPQAGVTISGKPMRLPERIEGGEHADWFDALPVTGLGDGIDATLDHWRKQAAA